MVHTRKIRSGFTIVELMVVIVIIGILATIVGLNYQNATVAARSSHAKSNAYAVQKVAESFYADKNRVPGKVSDFSYNPLAKVPDGIVFLASGQSLSPTNGETSIDYDYLGTADNATGARIVYWDFGKKRAASPIYIGIASDSSTNWQNL